ncbi:hypothetical protein OS493_037608, partial [Desmophyllum pertusum]
YLEKRFSTGVSLYWEVVCFIIQTSCCIWAIVVSGPANSFGSQGGMKDVFWNEVFFQAIVMLGGLIGECSIVGTYKVGDCDPISDGRIKTGDQILPYFVMHVLGSLYGVPGLFMACLFSGTLRPKLVSSCRFGGLYEALVQTQTERTVRDTCYTLLENFLGVIKSGHEHGISIHSRKH